MDAEKLEYVGFWPRVGASLLDGILIMFATMPLLFVVYGKEYWLSESIVQGPADLLISWILPAAAVIWFWTAKQATPGKMAIGAKVVDAKTGEPLSVGQSIGRYLGYFVATVPLFFGIVWVAFDSKKQGWHDKLAGTVVVRKKDRSPESVKFGPP